jgi:hypothetical protein
VLGVRQLHAGAERDLHEVRYVWQHDGVFLTVICNKQRPLGKSGLIALDEEKGVLANLETADDCGANT